MTDELLCTTRAVRRRLDLSRPVEPEVIVDCIRIAQQAPTASNTQTWRWVVVTDPAKRRALGELYVSSRAAVAGARAEASDIDAQTKRVYDSAEYLLDCIAEVPVHVIPCLEERLASSHNCVSASFYGSIFPAVWSFQLALRSRGLGSVLTTLHLLKEEEVAKLLQIPEHVTQACLLPVAYTIGTVFKPAARPPAEQIIHWNGWRQG
jgi:nitroreductase